MIAELGAWDALLAGWAVCACLMLALWLYARRRSNATIVDVGWATGLGLLAVSHALVSPGAPERRLLVACLGAAWAFRLAAHLAVRMYGRAEDPRYVQLRARWGTAADRNFLPFFQAQGLLVVILSVSFLVVARNPRAGLGYLDVAGLGIWLVAVGGEAWADRQLASFRADPTHAGEVCRSGLWRWSRHPNYFFEWLHWLAYVPLAWGSPWWMATLIAPVLMLFLIVKVTGIPPTEAQALRSRGAAYAAYQRTTSAFVPWPPLESAAQDDRS